MCSGLVDSDSDFSRMHALRCTSDGPKQCEACDNLRRLLASRSDKVPKPNDPSVKHSQYKTNRLRTAQDLAQAVAESDKIALSQTEHEKLIARFRKVLFLEPNFLDSVMGAQMKVEIDVLSRGMLLWFTYCFVLCDGLCAMSFSEVKLRHVKWPIVLIRMFQEMFVSYGKGSIELMRGRGSIDQGSFGPLEFKCV